MRRHGKKRVGPLCFEVLNMDRRIARADEVIEQQRPRPFFTLVLGTWRTSRRLAAAHVCC